MCYNNLMEFPLWIMLIPYAIAVFCALIFVFFNIYHIASFGLQSTKTTMIIGVYILSYLFVMIISLSLIATVDWSADITLQEVIQGVQIDDLLL